MLNKLRDQIKANDEPSCCSIPLILAKNEKLAFLAKIEKLAFLMQSFKLVLRGLLDVAFVFVEREGML